MFKLKRPCKDCPFRKGMGQHFQLHAERLEEIVSGPAFQCHKTVDYDEEEQVDGDWDETWRPVKNDNRAQQCAGLMAVLHRSGEPNQIMQVAERLGHLDPTSLDPDGEACDSIEHAFAEHGAGGTRRRRW